MVANKLCTVSVSSLINLSGLLMFQIFPFEMSNKTKKVFIIPGGEIRNLQNENVQS
jgi:hypothetical protein